MMCQFDPLRHEGAQYAMRLAQANVPVELHLYPGTFDGAHLIPGTEISERMKSDATAALRRALL